MVENEEVCTISEGRVGMKYKLDRKDFEMWLDRITFLPTVELLINEPHLDAKNFSIVFHFLVWHGRLRFCKEVEQKGE